MDVIEVLKRDYERFPEDQTYDIYAPDVYFQDPLNRFRGRDRYRQNIQFIRTWFRKIRLDLHEIRREGERIHTEWTLSWNGPLPWQPHITIPGWSELQLNAEELVISHIDYWHCSRFEVLRQHFSLPS